LGAIAAVPGFVPGVIAVVFAEAGGGEEIDGGGNPRSVDLGEARDRGEAAMEEGSEAR